MRILLLLFILSLSGCQSNWNLDPVHVKESLEKDADQWKENKVKVSTRLGDFEMELDTRTPLHRMNFIRLVKLGYYEDRYFYRIIYVTGIQGGGEYMDRLNYLIPAEYIDDLKPVRGSLAMARYDEGNPEQASSPSEFFIVTDTEQAARFYKKYVVFGKVTKGMEVVDAIFKAKSYDEKPVIPVKFDIKVLPE